MRILYPYSQTPSPREGAECGAAALTKQGCLQSVAQSHYARTHKDSHTKPLHDATAQMAVIAQMQRHQRLTTRIGATPKARMLWLLAKSFARCKTSRASNAKHPFFDNDRGFSTDCDSPDHFDRGCLSLICLLFVGYQLLVKFILSDTSKTSSPVGIVTFPFVTVSVSLSYDFVYPSMNISGSFTVSPLFV